MPSTPPRRPRFETLAVHSGLTSDPTTGGVAPSIHLSTTFERRPDGEPVGDYVYTRTENPNRAVLETALAELEGGSAAFAFASGLAAIHAVLQTLHSGDHVVMPEDVYHGSRHLIEDVMARWGLRSTAVDTQHVDQVRAAMTPRTRMILVETPSNPLLRTTDIAAMARLAREHDALCVVDNTWMTPVFQRPLELGAHVVVHSSTKYFGGHSDVQGGAVICGDDGDVGAEPVAERLRAIQNFGGAVQAPFDSWLIRRGLQSLPLRVRAQADTAMTIARFLDQHAGVEAVHYPGLKSDPGHEITRRQSSGFGSMLSVRVKDGFDGAQRVTSRVELFTRATSLGGVESLIEHRVRVEGPDTPTPPDLLRLSIGLEHADDLIADLDRAFG